MNLNPRRTTVRTAIGVTVALGLCLGSASTALAAPVSKGNASTKANASKACYGLGVLYAADMKALDKAHASGDQNAINQARANVNSDISGGYAAGCSWAS
jgi:hypothetical protein